MTPRNGIFAFAGLWERWKSPGDGSILRSFTIVTGPANELCRPIHDRMPVTLSPESWSMWLGEEQASPEQLLALLKLCPDDLIRAYPVNAAVGNVKNDTPDVLVSAGADVRIGDLAAV